MFVFVREPRKITFTSLLQWTGAFEYLFQRLRRACILCTRASAKAFVEWCARSEFRVIQSGGVIGIGDSQAESLARNSQQRMRLTPSNTCLYGRYVWKESRIDKMMMNNNDLLFYWLFIFKIDSCKIDKNGIFNPIPTLSDQNRSQCGTILVPPQPNPCVVHIYERILCAYCRYYITYSIWNISSWCWRTPFWSRIYCYKNTHTHIDTTTPSKVFSVRPAIWFDVWFAWPPTLVRIVCKLKGSRLSSSKRLRARLWNDSQRTAEAERNDRRGVAEILKIWNGKLQ